MSTMASQITGASVLAWAAQRLMRRTWSLKHGCNQWTSEEVLIHPCASVDKVRPRYNTIHIDGSMQERRNSIANTLELCLSCTDPSKSIKNACSWPITWWRHQMEIFFALLALCAGNSPVTSPGKGQCRGPLMFSLICARINGWVNNRDTGDLRRQRGHFAVIVMRSCCVFLVSPCLTYVLLTSLSCYK